MWILGISAWDDGSISEGEFNDDKRQGYDEFKWPDGRGYKGK